MEILKIVLIVIAGLLGLYVFLSIFLGIAIIQFSIRPLYQSLEHHRKNNIKKGYNIDAEEMERKEFIIELKDKYLIHAEVSLNNDPKKFVIVSHGHCGNRNAAIRYARVFYKLGYSVVMFDQRGHGENKHTKCLMGLQEHKDLLEIISYVRKTYGNDIELGLFGVSMGGASTLMALKEEQNLKFAVIDCAFADVETVFNDQCDHRFVIHHHLANPIGRAWLKVIHGLSFKDICPKNYVVNNHVPCLFIHGSKDDLIEPRNQKMIINNLPKDCYYENYIFEGAKHDNSVKKNYSLYKETVKNFIKNVNNLNK